METSDQESERLADEAREPDQDSDEDEDEHRINFVAAPTANKRKRSDVPGVPEVPWELPWEWIRHCSGYYGCENNNCIRCLHKLVLRKKGHFE